MNAHNYLFACRGFSEYLTSSSLISYSSDSCCRLTKADSATVAVTTVSASAAVTCHNTQICIRSVTDKYTISSSGRDLAHSVARLLYIMAGYRFDVSSNLESGDSVSVDRQNFTVCLSLPLVCSTSGGMR